MHVVQAVPLSEVVRLVNEWGTTPRLEAGEGTEPYPEPAALPTLTPQITGPVADGDAELVHLADRLHPVFAAGDPAERAALLMRLMDDAALRPWLGAGGGTLVTGWQVPRRTGLALAAVVVPVYEHLARHGSARLGVCSAHRCADVYLDESRPGTRRYCSISCQNRHRVATFRAGRRDTSA